MKPKSWLIVAICIYTNRLFYRVIIYMSAGSGASNLGYGGTVPLSNVNGNYVNVGNTNNPIHFGSNQIPGTFGLPGLAGAKSNVDAAAGIVPGICMNGGALKRKIKNITKKYKMRSKRNLTTLKNRVRARYSRALALAKSKTGGRKRTLSRSRSRSRGRSRGRGRSRSRSQRGGYSQYQNNLPMTQTYSLGGTLDPKMSALASPPPYEVLPNNTSCTDNYNHFTGKGFPSVGH